MNNKKSLVPIILGIVTGVAVLGTILYMNHINSLAYLTSQYETTKTKHTEAQEALLLKKLELAEECVKEDYERCKDGPDGVREVTKRLHSLLPEKHDDWKPRYDTPDDLYYTYLSEEKVDISQTPRQHYARNGLLATDVATYDKPLTMYAPDLKGEEVEYNVEYWDDYQELGKAMILTSGNKRFIIGHIRSTLEQNTVETGEEIGITLCPGDPNAGVTTGCHLHIMYQVDTGGDWQAAEYKIEKNYLKHKEWKKKRDKDVTMVKDGYIKFTTYNPEVGQTDDAPCSGRAGDVCQLYKEGKNPIALSRDLIQAETEFDANNGYCTENCPFQYGDQVLVTPKDHWQGKFVATLVDTMNKRYENRGDLFKDVRSKNTSFYANVEKL